MTSISLWLRRTLPLVPSLTLFALCAVLAMTAACSVDVTPLSPGDGGGRADGGEMDGGTDSGTDACCPGDAAPDAIPGIDASNEDAGSDAGTDAGTDAGMDAGSDAGTDAGSDAGMDAGSDAGVDAGSDAGVDSGDDAGMDAGTDAGMDASVVECTVDNECAAQDCYEANCASGTCVQTPQPFGLLTEAPLHNCVSAYCDGSGNTIMLDEASDLPVDDFEFCTREACSGPTPTYVPLDDGTPLPPMDQVSGDCKEKRCAGGMTTDVNDDSDQPVGTACGLGTCTNGVAGTTPVAAGLSCGSDLVCDTAGDCISCVPQTGTCVDDWQCCGGDCFGGICGASCATDRQDCDGIDSNGCETAINTLTDCGACGAVCAIDNATETCATGTCAIASCTATFADCNSDLNDGCERSLRTLSDCGVCDAACARANATATCDTGTCTLDSCDVGWASCDNVVTNGCETPTNTVTDCGGCNVPCVVANATATCASGTCVPVACDTGFEDCDNNPTNGCEAAIGTQLHCSMCGDACTAPNNRLASCDMGVCTVGACVTGFQDCDGNDANGCEWNINSGACPCVGTADSDGDGLTNCSEIDDSDPYTDPDIFNGAHVTHYPICNAGGLFGGNVDCADYDTLGEVLACTGQAAARETLDQYAGWDFDDPPGNNNPINAAGFGFLPNWSGVNVNFQIDAQAFINITQTGRHCFDINGLGGAPSSCGSLYMSTVNVAAFCGWPSLPANTPTVVQHGDAAVCLQLTPGVYPFRWHLDRDTSSNGAMHLDYCFGGGSNCAPTDAVPARMLRATYTLTCQVPAGNCAQGSFNGHDYWLCDDAMTWPNARAACQAVGMDLAIINDSNENDYLANLINTDHWIALSDAVTERTWTWAPTGTAIWIGNENGAPVGNNYVNWNSGEPNGDNTRNCGELLASGEWNDTTCPTAQAFICEEP